MPDDEEFMFFIGQLSYEKSAVFNGNNDGSNQKIDKDLKIFKQKVEEEKKLNLLSKKQR